MRVTTTIIMMPFVGHLTLPISKKENRNIYIVAWAFVGKQLEIGPLKGIGTHHKDHQRDMILP